MKERQSSYTCLLCKTRFMIIPQILMLMLVVFISTRLFLLGISTDYIDITLSNFSSAMFIGFIYDLAFCSYALIPIAFFLLIVPDRLWRTNSNRYVLRLMVFVIAYSLGFIAVSEYLFWEEFQVRFNFISVDYLVYSKEVTDNINESYPLKLILSLIAVFAFIVQYRFHKVIDRVVVIKETYKSRIVYAAILVYFSVVSLYMIDQDMKDFSDNQYYNEIASNGPYQFFSAFRNNELDYNQFYATLNEKDVLPSIKKELNIDYQGDNQMPGIYRNIRQEGDEKHLNVFLIMVESLSAKYIGSYGSERHLTPFLDELAQKSQMYTKFYATGTRTTRGLEAVTLSIPPTPGRSIAKRVGRESGMWSLGNVLKDKGYATRFLYGGRGYFDNMNSFFSGNGYEITDQSTVPDEEVVFSNAWGMSDEDLYSQAVKEADKVYENGKPFLFHLMTTSNHRPYTYPAGRIDIPSGDGRGGAVKYTDWALKDLFEKVKDKPWFEDTLFVIVADHCAGSAGRTSLPISKYHIPLFIYSPEHIPAEEIDTLSSQIDLAPTLLSMLNMSYPSSAFGQDILSMSPGRSRALIANYQHLGLYDGKTTTILSPMKRITRQDMPDSDHPAVSDMLAMNPLSRRAISYYQSASKVYSEKLNAWKNSAALSEDYEKVSSNY